MRRIAFIPLVLALAAAACATPVDPDPADVAGTITLINPETSTLGVRQASFVCTNSSSSAPCVTVNLVVTGKVYMQELNGLLHEIPFESIPIGVNVQAWTTGGTFLMVPAQMEAMRVIVQSPK